MDNLDYLFWGHTLMWVLVFAYLVFVTRKGDNIRHRIEELEQRQSRGSTEGE